MEDLTGNSSKTTFYVESFPDKIKRFAWIVVAIALIVGGIIIWSGIGSGARRAMDHAKDVRMALKMVSVEYYGGKVCLYDPSKESGMTDEALARIANLIPLKGEITLTGWDDDKNIPLSFTYREGRYMVEYRDVGTGSGTYEMNGDWNVYYSFKVLEYTAGD
ncbi:MAG: hypothetical protein IKI46_03835 [Lachnospiraceae bacterium]|nr:hypothetical protein [Lachnospiraceae bacterium]